MKRRRTIVRWLIVMVLPAFQWVVAGRVTCRDARHSTLSADSWTGRAVVGGPGGVEDGRAAGGHLRGAPGGGEVGVPGLRQAVRAVRPHDRAGVAAPGQLPAQDL